MKLLNSNRFSMPGTGGAYVHLASVQDGLREYIFFVNSTTMEAYIEEITSGNLQFIPDENKVKEIADFLFDHHINNLNYGAPVPDKGFN